MYYIYLLTAVSPIMNVLKNILFALLLFPVSLYAQWNDDFTDNDFTTNPAWSGNAADWTIVSGQLRSNGPAVTPTTIYLSTPSTAAMNTQWEFFVNPKCATSSGNYMIVTLMSDQADITGSYNGYYVMIGNTADDISLYRKDGATATILIDGTNSTISSSTNNPYSIKIVRDAADNWTLFIDNTGTGTNYITDGTVVDATYSTSSFFGVLCTYSASNNQKYFFDNFYAGPIIVDNTPPAIISASTISSTEVDLLFDENVEQTTAETISNYVVNNSIGNATVASRDATNNKLVHLTFGTAFTSGQNYILTATNVQDLTGNAITTATASFSYLAISSATYREVIVNEIFPDPSPQIGLPVAEFIELYNRSNNNFDLSNWTYTDGNTSTTMSNFILQPGQFVILCPVGDTALYSAYGPTIGLTSFPSLNNSGDTVRILNSSGTIIDQVIYSDNWYQDVLKKDGGYTLELINPTLDCSNSNNWTASNAASGGTPGIQNSVNNNSPDLSAPQLNNVQILSQSQIMLTFSESMDSASIANATITLSAPLATASIIPVAPDFIQTIISFTPALDSTLAYSITMSNATDCSGNSMTTNTISFGIGVPAQRYEIVISELFPDPDGSTYLPQSEFVELYNNTSKVLNISGYTINDATSSSTINNAVLFPNDYLILAANANVNDYLSYGKVLGMTSFISLNNASDNISLKNPAGQIIHRVHYTDSWYQDAAKKNGGWTLEMIDPNNPCGELNNWHASADTSGGTPGRQNAVWSNNPDVTNPDILLAEAFDSTLVVLQFDEIMDSASIMNATFAIDNGISITSQSVYGDRTALLYVSPALQHQIIYTISAQLCTDCVGNPVSTKTAQFALPDQAAPGDLIINEVLFDPRGSGADFVEIYNNSQRFISLNGWTLANYSNDTIANPKTITSNMIMIYPGEYTILTTDPDNILQEYPAGYYNRFLRMNSMPTYANDQGHVVLIDNLNRLSDEFSYNSTMHFALLNSADGVSLERIDFNRPTEEESNWHSAAESVNYATPGYKNSESLPAENGATITISPETFSPDNDGYNDIVNISYQFEEPGYVGNITIYDASGRIEKYLMRSELLGTTGTKSWDGINEKREKSTVGIYVVYFEVFDLQGNIQHYKKALVVATKF